MHRFTHHLALFFTSILLSTTLYAGITDLSQYDIYYDDVDGDGVSDLYFRGRDPLILLHGDVITPIAIDVESFYIEGTYDPEAYCDIDPNDPNNNGDEVPYCEEGYDLDYAIKVINDDVLNAYGLLVEGVNYHLFDSDGDGKKELILDLVGLGVGASAVSPELQGYDDNSGSMYINAFDSLQDGIVQTAGTLGDFSSFHVEDTDGDGRESLVISNGEFYADQVFDFNGSSFVSSFNESSRELLPPTLHGASTGSFRVNESGAANYSIPLTLPAGTAGVAPSLALNYSSQGGNGLLAGC